MTGIGAPAGYDGPRRALILAGGGMRVSWQAGVLCALEERGVQFTHGDGTSGGSMNLAAILSGISPQELSNRWETLEPRQFSSFAPLADFFKRSGAMAFGSADGIISEVYPHLGIDIDLIHASKGIEGRFNVCNFTRKVVEPIAHEVVRMEHLVAAVSLPIFMPPVCIDGTMYTDAVWIKDANLIDAVKRGAEELWLIWCIGHTPEYRRGMLNQYVHMIEMSANGGLAEEFDRINEVNERIASGEQVYGHSRPIRLHVIRPDVPLPLDPDYFFGKITASELIALGYAAASRYLDNRTTKGLSFKPEVLMMSSANSAGVEFDEVMKGNFVLGATEPAQGEAEGRRQNSVLALHASITVPDADSFIADPAHAAGLKATVTFTPWKNPVTGDGVFKLFAKSTETPGMKLMVYETALQYEGKPYYLAGRKEVRDDRGPDMWKDTTTLFTKLHSGTDKSGPVVGAGILTISAAEFSRVVKHIRVIGTDDDAKKAQVAARFGRFFAGELWDSYAPAAQPRPTP
jgi:predicted patatin/cPLA2 family phospholipase